MKLTTETKKYIDTLTYEEMLKKHRFEPLGSDLFIGESGDYFYQKFMQLKRTLSHTEQVKSSKRVGWKK